ncbi:Two component system response regulator, sigma54-specific [Desulfonema limicola]|uniref:Two component system response regulator, sigma54-specific n=1 Tax=Desulfonema limicola TaxID=45656 RepID=A0A975B949_9BACT|nr:sigma-54 dependent transcriptional regulator [Desulfonema limicola]QTA81070.1 Two component system response regulator, sigma54-specific [Desulfonema limicola]
MDKENKATVLNILIVDDEANIRKTLSYCLAAEGHMVIAVSNPEDAVEEARRRSFDMAFVDLKLGDEDGMELIPVLLSDSSWIKIVVITAHASIETAVEAIKLGAADYIAKPFTPDQVKLITRRMGKIRELETEIVSLRENIQQIGPENSLVTKNPGMQRIIETLKKAAVSDAIILLQGESGTGKSIFARAVHNWSLRAAKPMAVVACPSVPSELLESEMFGHARGAFTGAVRDNPGRIAACEGGTLLLDEIGDMAPGVQAKLLRFIQDREYERLGESILRRADVRIIAATNADLEKKAADGSFREDLFYRLNVISLTIPPLRQRPEDILPLAEGFLAYFSRVNHRMPLSFTDQTKESLVNHSWPGNVRELRNAVERAVILGNGDKISMNDLPGNIIPAVKTPAIGDKVSLAAIEELHIRRLMASTSSLQEAADILGIDQTTLWRRRKTYGI